jgi:hypothetical protein
MPLRRRLRLERLDDRITPATTGETWPDAKHLTLSFVPDGTPVAGHQSNLFQRLNAVAPASDWQREFIRAFQTWAVHANVNVGVVADGGEPVGSGGAVQGDGRFGDVRIAAAPLPASTLMTNTTFQWSGTTWSGDIVVNTSYAFSIGGQPGTYDLFTAALNEAGNVFGVLDSHTDPASGVYYQYVGPKTGLTAGDIADIRSLYGSRTPDHFESALSNDNFAGATPLSNTGPAHDPEADISHPGDVDFYRLTIPLTVPPVVGFWVEIATGGLSALAPSVTVYNGAYAVVATNATTDPCDGGVDVQVNGVLAGQPYYIRVAGHGPGVFATGGYRLNVVYQKFGGILTPLIGAVNQVLDDFNLNDTIATATDLTPGWTTKPDARFDAFAAGRIENTTDVDFYRIRSPGGWNKPLKLNALVWATRDGRLAPRLDIYDATGQKLPTQLLANENGTFSVEWTAVEPLTTYYAKVSALHPQGSRGIGSYQFGANFTPGRATALAEAGRGTADPAGPAPTFPLTVRHNGLMQFRLAAFDVGNGGKHQAKLDIITLDRGPVFALRSYVGDPAATGHVYLAGGRYLMRVTASPPPGAAPAAVTFDLAFRLVSNPIGPQRDRGSTSLTPPPSDWGLAKDADWPKDGWDDPYYF